MPKISAIHWRKFDKFLLKVGCTLDRQEGDHRMYHHRKGISRPIVLPMWKSVPVFIIKNNLTVLGIKHNEYLGILKKL